MEKKKIPTEVYAEMTPNPSTMKFVVDRLLIEGGEQVEYTSAAQVGDSSPLAAELFNFPFVRSLFFSGNYVTITKDDSLGWEMIVMQVREYMRDWLMENEVAVAYVPEGLTPQAPSEVVQNPSPSKSNVDYSSIPPSEYDDQIRILLDEFVRPAVEQDGGAIDFKAYQDGKVYVQMRGACSGCPSSMMTLKGGIEQLLKSKIPAVEAVVAEEA
jgi:Fe-S cluster biogenesis protein NfuA